MSVACLREILCGSKQGRERASNAPGKTAGERGQDLPAAVENGPLVAPRGTLPTACPRRLR